MTYTTETIQKAFDLARIPRDTQRKIKDMLYEIEEEPEKQSELSKLLYKICRHEKVKVSLVKSKLKLAELVRVRVAFYELAKTQIPFASLDKIGSEINRGRFAVQEHYPRLMRNDRGIREYVEGVKTKLKIN